MRVTKILYLFDRPQNARLSWVLMCLISAVVGVSMKLFGYGDGTMSFIVQLLIFFVAVDCGNCWYDDHIQKQVKDQLEEDGHIVSDHQIGAALDSELKKNPGRYMTRRILISVATLITIMVLQIMMAVAITWIF